VTVRALRGVDLELYTGELVVLMGASGSGKSTLLNILGGLDLPSSGEVSYGDLDLSVANDRLLTRYRRENVGFVFQFYNLIPSLTALENVAVVTEIAANPMAPEEALRLVGLQDRGHHFPAQLSGGEQQRVAIARAIVGMPPLLLADEPTGNLDPMLSRELFALFEQLSEQGTTVLIASHDLDLIRRMRKRVLVLSTGRLADDIPASDGS